MLLNACGASEMPAMPDDPRPAPTSEPGASEPGASEPDDGDLPSVPGKSWELVDQDDFDGAELDDARWSVYDSLSTNQISRWNPENVVVEDGELRIIGRGQDPTGQENEAGGLCWCGDGNQTYGMWQMRARLEPAQGYGQAFILWPQTDNWPEDGEIDFAEMPKAAKDEVIGTVHWGTDDDHQINASSLDADLTQWHTYTVVWQPDLIQMYLDDDLFYDSTTADEDVVVPDGPMHLAVQVEPGPFGNDWVPAPGPDTPENVTHIDWVKMYR
jgi:endo-1,3-1,4-beta-glycanase ExoK